MKGLDIPSVNTSTPEFTIWKLPGDGYLIELDGEEVGIGRTIKEAHAIIKQYSKSNAIKAAGVTEVFGRNRQFILTNRYAFKAYKEKPNGHA